MNLPGKETGYLPSGESPLFVKSRYVSPFPRDGFNQHEASQPYKGTLSQLMEELGAALKSPEKADPYIIALHPPRIMRAVTDHFVTHPHQMGKLPLLERAVKLGRFAYQRDHRVLHQLEAFRRLAADLGQEELMNGPLVQVADIQTWVATHPDKSLTTARKLINITKRKSNEDILFIALGHGGVAAGLDVFCTYVDFTGSDNSRFWPVRFSRIKMKDTMPQWGDAEKGFLREMAVGSNVIIFDEDKNTGTTLEQAEIFFNAGLGLTGDKKATVLFNHQIQVQLGYD